MWFRGDWIVCSEAGLFNFWVLIEYSLFSYLVVIPDLGNRTGGVDCHQRNHRIGITGVYLLLIRCQFGCSATLLVIRSHIQLWVPQLVTGTSP